MSRQIVLKNEKEDIKMADAFIKNFPWQLKIERKDKQKRMNDLSIMELLQWLNNNMFVSTSYNTQKSTLKESVIISYPSNLSKNLE